MEVTAVYAIQFISICCTMFLRWRYSADIASIFMLQERLIHCDSFSTNALLVYMNNMFRAERLKLMGNKFM